MKKRVIGVFAAFCLCLSLLPTTGLAFGVRAWTEVGTWEEFEEAWNEGSAEESVRLMLTDDITLEDELTACADTSYQVKSQDGERFVLRDVALVGEENGCGTVWIFTDIELDDGEAAMTVFWEGNDEFVIEVNGSIDGGLAVYGNANITVNGDITGAAGSTKIGDAGAGVNVALGAAVTVNGNVTGGAGSENWMAGTGVEAFYASEVVVNGDVIGGSVEGDYCEAGAGIKIGGGSSVKVKGDVIGGSAEGESSIGGAGIFTGHGDDLEDSPSYGSNTTSEISVLGKIIGGSAEGEYCVGGHGVNIYGAEVNISSGSVFGGIYGGSAAGNGSEGGDGVYAECTAKLECTITGSITGGKAEGEENFGSGSGINANGRARIFVKGDVSAAGSEGDLIYGYGYGIEAYDATVVNVEGNVSAGVSHGEQINGGSGIYAEGRAKVSISGDVTGGKVSGTESFAGAGVEAYDDTVITVSGNVYGGSGALSTEEMEEPNNFSDGGNAVEISYGNALITVSGSAIGGNGAGTGAEAGHGVSAECDMYPDYERKTITVMGNAVGGSVKANPKTPDGARQSIAGSGVYANNTSNVIVKGDAIGGNSNADEGTAGQGIYLNMDDMYDEEELCTVRVEGTAIGGKATGENGYALFFNVGEEQENNNLSVQVWQLSDENGGIAAAYEHDEELCAALMDRHVSYIIKTAKASRGEITVDKPLAKPGETVTVEISESENDNITVSNNRETLKPDDDGSYRFEVEAGGGYIISTHAYGSSDAVGYGIVPAAAPENGSVSAEPRHAEKGETVIITVTPDKGYVLETLTVLDKNGNEIELIDEGDGKFSFTMPGGQVTISAIFAEDNSMLNFFVDVPTGEYYYDAVLWAAENGIASGVADTHFAPNQSCTRAQIVTFLWRAAGCPEPKNAENPFDDISADKYYYKAVLWAVEQGITTGTESGRFSPDTVCTRGQAVSFIYRSVQANGGGFTGAWMFNIPFTDVPEWCYEAVAWCYMNEITGGTGSAAFSPDADCTRAQIVSFLYRAQ